MNVLKITNPENCTGCSICVLAASNLINQTLSVANAPIRIERSKSGGKEIFTITIDEALNEKLVPIAQVCPQMCFSVTREDE